MSMKVSTEEYVMQISIVTTVKWSFSSE